MGAWCCRTGPLVDLAAAFSRLSPVRPGRPVRRAAAGLPPVTAAAGYDSPVRELLIAYKERGVLRLAAPLGAALRAGDPRAATAPAPPSSGAVRLVLVPVPSRPSVVRARGHDPTARIAAVAARRLGPGVRSVPLLRQTRRVADQSGLGTPRSGRPTCPGRCGRGPGLRGTGARPGARSVGRRGRRRPGDHRCHRGGGGPGAAGGRVPGAGRRRRRVHRETVSRRPGGAWASVGLRPSHVCDLEAVEEEVSGGHRRQGPPDGGLGPVPRAMSTEKLGQGRAARPEHCSGSTSRSPRRPTRAWPTARTGSS